MSIIKYVFLIFLIFFFNISFAQNKYVNSLKQSLATSTNNSDKILILENLVELYRSERQYDLASLYARQLLQLAKREKNDLEIVKGYTFLGIIANNQERYSKASQYIDSTKIASTSINNELAKAYTTYLQAYQENSFEDYKKAMALALKSLTAIDSHGQDYNLSFKLYYMLYGIYTNWNDLPNTMKYAQLALEYAKLSDNKNNESNAYSILAVAYTYKYEKSKKKEDLDLIIKNAETASNLGKQYPGQVANNTKALAYNNLASYYLMYFPKRTPEVKKKIEDNIKEALKISQELPNIIIYCLINHNQKQSTK